MTPINELTLLHKPYGIHHPYEVLPYERSPRDPRPGQAVEINVAVASNDTVDQVWLEYSISADVRLVRLEASRVGSCDAGQIWRATLPPVAGGQTVSYRWHATSAQCSASSEEYHFAVPEWVDLKAIASAQCTQNTLHAQISTSRPDWFVNLELQLEGEQVHQQWQFGAAAENTAATPMLALENANLALELHSDPPTLEIRHLKKGYRIVERFAARLLVDGNGRAVELHQTYASPQDEAFFGFGERFNALNQRGNFLDTRVYEQYRKQGKRTYFPEPFFLSSLGYGQYQETNREVDYDLASADADQVVICVELGADQRHSTHWFCPDTPAAVIQQYTAMTGKPSLPPKWVFGLWMSSNEWNSQEIVLDQLRQTIDNHIPASVLVIEAWSDERNFYIWNDAQIDLLPPSQRPTLKDYHFPAGGKWPDPLGMIQELHKNGIRLVLWQIPAYKRKFEPDQTPDEQHAIDGAYMVEKGYVVRNPDGTPYEIRSPWFGRGYLPDFTNPEATAWWIDKRRYLVEEMGVDGFKTDGAEHIWGRDLVFSDGRRSDELWNQYPVLYQKAYYELANSSHPGQGALFSRSGFVGAQQYPCHWAGDEFSTFDAFRASILAGLSLGVSGVPFWGWDIGGFSGEVPSAELYLRATAMAAFCPIMQYHSEYNGHRTPNHDRTPWNIQARSGDERVLPTFRFYANLRVSLLPYLWSEAIQSAQSGLPMMRALPVVYPEDRQALDYPYQYLFGSSLLVAPVVVEGQSVQTVYLPNGVWYDLWTGEKWSGGRTIAVNVPLERIPVFVKGGSLLPLDLGEDLTLGNALGDSPRRVFRVYAGEESAETVYYTDPDQPPLRIRIEPDGSIQSSAKIPGLIQGAAKE